MLNFNFYSPTQFVFGKGEEANIGTLLAARGAKKVLLHYGGQSAEKSGLLGRVRASLQQASVPFIELGGVHANPRYTLALEGMELARKENVDLILAVGGGSVVDSAKCIAIGALYNLSLIHIYVAFNLLFFNDDQMSSVLRLLQKAPVPGSRPAAICL